jgi:hypothetical protein
MNAPMPLNSRYFNEKLMIRAAGAIIVMLLSAYVYRPIATMSFCVADDPWMLLVNKYAHPGAYTPQYFHQVFTRINDIQYSPLNTLVYSLIYKFNAYDPYYFHLFNFSLHMVNGLLVLLLARKILLGFAIPNAGIVAYFVYLLWCLHPLNVEPVVWISGSKILICTFLTLVSFNCFVSGFLHNKLLYYVVSMLFFVLSCFCKEQGIITPFMCLLFAVCYRLKRGPSWHIGQRATFFISLSLLFSIAFGVFTMYTVNELTKSNFVPVEAYPIGQRILLSFYCIRFYLINFLIPINLHYHYPFPIRPSGSLPLTYALFSLLFLSFCIFFALLIRKSRNFYFFTLCIGIFLLQIALELQIIPMTRPAIVADRYMYLPSFGLLLAGMHLLVNKCYFIFTNNKAQRLCAAFFIIYALYFTSYSNQLVKNWAQFNIVRQ